MLRKKYCIKYSLHFLRPISRSVFKLVANTRGSALNFPGWAKNKNPLHVSLSVSRYIHRYVQGLFPHPCSLVPFWLQRKLFVISAQFGHLFQWCSGQRGERRVGNLDISRADLTARCDRGKFCIVLNVCNIRLLAGRDQGQAQVRKAARLTLTRMWMP